MKPLLLILLLSLTCSFTLQNKAMLVTGKDVNYLFKELNKARKNPVAYGKEIKFNLNYSKRSPLILDEELTLIAQEKAVRMAQLGELTHYEEDGSSTISKVKYSKPAESCNRDYIRYQMNGNRNHVKDLLIDSRGENGHRNQLLGIGYSSDHNVVGIGLATNNLGESYCCIITAKK